MTTARILCIMLLVCCVSVQAESKRYLNAYISGGAYVSTDKNSYKNEYGADFGVGVRLGDAVSLVPHFGFYQGSDFTVSGVGMDVRLLSPASKNFLSVFVVGGLASAAVGSAYNRGESLTDTGSRYLCSNIGGGLEYALGKLNDPYLLLQIRYVTISGGISTITFVPIELGIKF